MAKFDLKNAIIKLVGGGTGEEMTVKLGDGSISWTEYRNMEYELDRGKLDTVRLGDEQPLDVNLEFMWEWLRGVTGANTPLDAIQVVAGTNSNYLSWTSTSADECEPFCIDIAIEYDVICGTTTYTEDITLAEFRYEQLDYSTADGQITVTGKCNVNTFTSVRSSS